VAQSIRRVVLIRIGSLGGEAAHEMPIPIKENRPTKILRFIIPPRNRHLAHRAGLHTAGPVNARNACGSKFGQARVKSAPLYFAGIEASELLG
jgi:hypothetical protein